jgi:hypothetical protein
MREDTSETIEKALAFNLDPLKYGTIVEIGAGQEVARWFFQAGGAAGTIAKTMSAYDMNYSDEVYGPAPDGRYVSRARLERMLEREFEVTTARMTEHRPDGTRFFVFANTVAAQGFTKRAECHGWLGIRLQTTPGGPADDIILHVRLLDDTNLDQQEALGILGVNLIHGAFHYADRPEQLLRSLTDNLRWGRLEIDLVEFRGPAFGHIDNRLMALELVKASLARAVLFAPDGGVVIPADAFYRHSVLIMRGEFHTVEQRDIDLFARGKARFLAQPANRASDLICLAELTMAELANDEEIDTADFLARVNRLAEAGYYVLISEFFRHFRVRQYLARYTREPVVLVIDTAELGEILCEDFYSGITGGVLEGLGLLFPKPTVAYVYPEGAGDKAVALDTLPIADTLRPLLTYLRACGQIVPVDERESAVV